MATMQQAIDFMKSKYKHEEITDTLFKLIFETDNGRTQLVFAEFTDDFIGFSSPFASTGDMTPKQALDAASGLLCGIKIVGDTYYVANLAPLENLDESEMYDNLILISLLADRLEENHVGGDQH